MTDILAAILPYAAAVVAAIGALVWARISGKRAAENEQQARERKAIDKAKEVQNENDAKTIDDIRSDASQWVRGNKR